MADISTIKTDITSIGDYQLEELFNYIGEMLTVGTAKSSLNESFKESRFSRGENCPHCQSTSIIKNGKLNERQRYVCKACHKSFNNLTKSALSYTKLPLDKWIEYAKELYLDFLLEKMLKIFMYVLKPRFICVISCWIV